MNPEKFNVVMKFLEKLVKDEEFLCKYCLENFETTEQLKVHSITKHMEKRFVCDFCFVEYKSSGGMVSHLINNHMFIPEITKKKPKRHKDDADYNYNPESDSESDSDDSVYDQFDDMGKKNKVPDREYPRKCDHCNYVVPQKRVHYHHYLYEHKDIIDQYPYGAKVKHPCSYCGVLKPATKLKMHEAKHSGIKVKCPTCGKQFNSQIHMTSHHRSVHTTKMLICDFCSKQFKTREDIMRHIRIHTGEKPYKCHICGAGFAHNGNRSLHIRSAHQNIKILAKKVKDIKKKTVKNNNTAKKGRGRPQNKKVKTICSDSESDDEVLSVLKEKKCNGKRKGKNGKKH